MAQDILTRAGGAIAPGLRRAGNLVNQYFGDVSTATAPGMTGDLLSYIQNELTKYPGTRDTDPNAPGFDVVNNVITNLLAATGLNDPAMQASPAQAMLGPIGRVTAEAAGSAGAAKGVNQAQKKILKALFRGDPETLKEVVQSPRMMHVGVPGAGETAGLSKQNQQELIDAVMQKAYAHFQPGGLGGTVRVHPSVMRGLSPRLKTPLKAQGVEGLPDMVTHEATHFLNEPGFDIMRKSESSPGLAQFDLGAALRPFLEHTAYGPRIVEQNLMRGNTPTAVNEALSYLAQPTGRAPAATWLHNALTDRPRAGGIAQFDDITQQLLQEVLGNLQNVPGVRRFR